MHDTLGDVELTGLFKRRYPGGPLSLETTLTNDSGAPVIISPFFVREPLDDEAAELIAACEAARKLDLFL